MSCFISWCLGILSNYSPFLLFQVPMILDTTTVAREEMCVLPPPRNLHPGKRWKGIRLSVFSSDGRLSHLGFVFETLFLLLLPPHQRTAPPHPRPDHLQAVFSPFGTISALYTQSANAKLSLWCCQCSSAPCVFGTVIGSTSRKAARFQPSHGDKQQPPPVSGTASIYKAYWVPGFPSGSAVKKPHAMQEMQERWVGIIPAKDALEQVRQSHPAYSCLETPWPESGGL